MHEPLSPTKMTSASLMCFFERGFTINPFQAHIPVEAKKTKRINFWSCTKDDQKYVLFDPCRDEVPDDEKETLTMISILDMQVSFSTYPCQMSAGRSVRHTFEFPFYQPL